jgi:hypothetical protein
LNIFRVGELADLKQENIISPLAVEIEEIKEINAGVRNSQISRIFLFSANLAYFSYLNYAEIRAKRRLVGVSRWLQQAHAMFIKRIIYFFRRWTQFITQLIIPVSVDKNNFIAYIYF